MVTLILLFLYVHELEMFSIKTFVIYAHRIQNNFEYIVKSKIVLEEND